MKWLIVSVIALTGCIAEPEPSSSVPVEDAGADAAQNLGTMDASPTDLGSDAGVQDAGGRDTGSECSQETVENEDGECVECTDNTHCLDLTPICEEGQCVCTADSDCPDGFPNCGADGQCFACSEVAVDRMCDESRSLCVGGRCQECRISSEEDDCEKKRCTPDGRCFGEKPDNQSFGACETCSKDAECGFGLRCVEIDSTGAGNREVMETVCLPEQGDGCERPYTRTIMSRESEGLNHKAVYCAPSRELSCEAVREYNTDCSNDTMCSFEYQHCVAIADGEGSRRTCVYECDTDLECPTIPAGTKCVDYSISDGKKVCAPATLSM